MWCHRSRVVNQTGLFGMDLVLVEFGLKSVKMFRNDFWPAYDFFSQRRSFLSPFTVKAIELNLQ